MQPKLTFALTILLCCFTEDAATASPKIADKTGVRTLATANDRSILARGSAFEITGSGLGPDDVANGDIPYQASLAGVSVQLASVSDSTVFVDAFVVSASAARIVAILPSSATGGDYRLTVSFNGEASKAFDVKIADTNFGIITNTGSFAGTAQGRVRSPDGNPVTFTLANSIAPGSTLEIDATGLGAIDTGDNDFPPEANAFPDAVLLIGGQEIPVTYLGRNPSKPGFDKLVVTLPSENLPSGCVVPAQIRIGDLLTLAFSIPLLGPDQTSCVHPLGVSPEGLATLANGGSIVRGGFTLVHLVGKTTSGGQVFESNVDQMAGGFVSFTADMIAQLAAQSLLAAAYDENGCVIYDAGAGGSSSGGYVDAGDSLSLTDPGWNVSLPRGTGQSLNQYNLTLNSLFNGAPTPGQTTPKLRFAPGPHTLSGTGGSVVGPFSVDINISGPLQWVNMDDTKEVDTSRDLILSFSGVGPEDTVSASALVKGPAPEAPDKIVSRIWECIVKGAAGQVVVPSSLLQKLPRVSAAELAAPSSGRYSSLTLGSYNPTDMGLFKAPLTDGGSTEIVPFLFNYTFSKAPVPVR